jgi:hypothetical protein
MAFKMNELFSRKNMNLIVSLLTFFVFLWVVMYAIPDLFINLFYTGLGNLILIFFVVLAFMYNINLAVGLIIVFIVLYRFSSMAGYEGMMGGIAGPTFIIGGAIPPVLIPVA